MDFKLTAADVPEKKTLSTALLRAPFYTRSLTEMSGVSLPRCHISRVIPSLKLKVFIVKLANIDKLRSHAKPLR